MAKSDARFEYRANLNRELHDLSAPFGFTCAPGMLLPVFEDIATPKDTYYIEHDLEYLRTLPLLAPAMIDVKVHLESFFVPFQMIYQPVENTLFGFVPFMSSFFDDTQSQNHKFPLFNYNAFKTSIMTNENHSRWHSDAFRMADMFGLNASTLAYDGNNPSRFNYNPSFFPWQILAYNTIYQYFYRLDDKENFTNDLANFDYWYNNTTGVNPGVSFFGVKQRPWDFDYFTSMYRSPIVSNENMQSLGGYVLNQNLANHPLSAMSVIGQNYNNASESTNSEIRSYGGDAPASYVKTNIQGLSSTAVIRQMFANEKLSMITGRARKTYDAQVLAHFGVDVPHDPKHDIAFIGRDTYELKIGEVTSLASTTTAGLGDLAGKGWAMGKGKKHKFVAPCHGVVMTIFSVEPLKRYYGGFDRINSCVDAFDIPTPEFERLGNVPMYRYETGELSGSGTVTATDIIGWKERYYCNKRRHAKVTMAFQNAPSSVGYNVYSAYMLTSAPFGAYTSTNNNTARPDLESRFYIDRNCMDGMMLTPYITNWQTGGSGEETTENWNKSPWLCYSRDPFIVDLSMKVKKVSWMSKDGEPIYNF